MFQEKNMSCLHSVMLVCALWFPLSALAAGLPEERFFSRDASDYALAAEVLDGGGLDAALAAVGNEIREAERLRVASPDAAFGLAKRAMFRCTYAWMLLQRPGQTVAPELNEQARELIGRVRVYFDWDKPALDRVAARTGGLLHEVITAREAREIVSRGIDPKEAAGAKALEK
jgi:hypothetical protein